MNASVGFDRLVEYYEKHKEKPWKEWLEVVKIFPRPGKQGLVGLMKAKNDDSIVYVFKISQYLNYLVQQELTVMKCLNSVSDYCPHFCRAVGYILADTDPSKRKEGNPLEIECKYPVEKEILLMEYVSKSCKFANYIKSQKIPEDILYSIVKQTMLAIAIAQKKKKLSHYDLHSNNVMIKKCNKNLVFLYVLDENTQFYVPTHGYYPVIIDYGFSYCQDMDGGFMWPTLNHTEVGFLCDRFDPVADPKLFLVTVSGEIRDERKSKNSRKLKNITKNIYKTLNLDWGSGWDKGIKKCAADYVIDKLEKIPTKSKVFKKNEYLCLDLVQSLIILPLEKQSEEQLKISYQAFTEEFSKLENEIGSHFYCLYLLKGIVDLAREVASDYRVKESRTRAVDHFRTGLYERIDSISKFCKPKGLNVEKMLCALLCLAKCIEGCYYTVMEKRMAGKTESYKTIPLQTPQEIHSVIDINIPDPYDIVEDTVFLVIDCIKETNYEFKLNKEQIEEINGYSSISRGTELYKIVQNLSFE